MGQIAEGHNKERGAAWTADLIQDFRFGLRTLFKISILYGSDRRYACFGNNRMYGNLQFGERGSNPFPAVWRTESVGLHIHSPCTR